MFRSVILSIVTSAMLLVASSAFASTETTVFPPVKLDGQQPVVGDAECSITYEAGQKSTKCRTGQEVLSLALQNCYSGQIVKKTDSGFECADNVSSGSGITPSDFGYANYPAAVVCTNKLAGQDRKFIYTFSYYAEKNGKLDVIAYSYHLGGTPLAVLYKADGTPYAHYTDNYGNFYGTANFSGPDTTYICPSKLVIDGRKIQQ